MKQKSTLALVNFSIKNIALTLGYLVIGWFLFTKTSLQTYYIPVLPYLLLGMLLINVAIFSMLVKVVSRDSKIFVNRFFSVTGIKLLLFLLVLVLYIFNNRESAYAFVGSFFALYIGFSIIEIREIIRLSKK